ncbi:MAG: hypothetical protein ACM3TR_14750 [Caulobacteraceae bacterium]
MNTGYLVDRKERLLNSFVVTGKAYLRVDNRISMPIFNNLCQLSRYKSLHGYRK